MRHQPPAFAKRILRWFVNAEFVEEIEGDLDELFNERLETHAYFKSSLLYIWDVFHAIRPYQPKRKSSEVGHEILNGIFLKLALRNLRKRKAFVGVNILGLSIGFVSFLLILEYVAFERSFDSFHTHAERIYRVAFNWGETDYNGENSSIYASSVPAMGPALAAEIPEVEIFTRFIPVLTVKRYCVITNRQNNQIKYSGNADSGFYADSSFLKVFSFPLLKGGIDPLSEPKSIALTRSFAKRIFGSTPLENIIGSSIEVDAQGKEDHIVTAILEDIPANSHIQFDFLISYATINSDRLEGNLGWSQFYTYVLTHHRLSLPGMEAKYKTLIKKLYGTDSHISIFFQPLREIYLNSELREEVSETGSGQQLIFLTIIAYIILFMAWINFINMFLATAMERVNEIGIKKVLGSSRAHLTIQFFTESLIINGFSLIISAVGLLLLQHPFEVWLGKEVSGVMWEKWELVSLVLASILFASIATGLYPAWMLASHNPTRILGSKFHSSDEGLFFKKGLVYFQFIISFVIVSSTMIVDRQNNFMSHADLGMDLTGRVAIRSPGSADSTYIRKLQLLKDRFLAHPSIQKVSSTSSIPGNPIKVSGGVQRVVGPELEGNNVFSLQVDENFLDTYAIRLIAGKNFSKESSGIPTVIINEEAVQTLKFQSPEEALNHRIHWQRKEFEVIGVFANYNHLFLKERFEPIMLSYNSGATGFITLKIRQRDFNRALADAKKTLESVFPETPFEYQFLESSFDHQYHSTQQFESLTKYFALLAIVIACLGLFALSYYAVQRRTKEIVVRKIFGAHTFNVFILLFKNYVAITLLSAVIGSFLTFYVMNKWLQNFAFAIELVPLDFLLPFIIITIIVLITVSYNCLKASSVNPSSSLKHV